MRSNGNEIAWVLDASNGYLKAPKDNNRYLGVYNKQDWRTYSPLHNNIAGQTLQLWKLSDGTTPDPDPEPTAPATPTASPAAGEVEKGTVVTFSTETSGATISYLVEGAAAWTEGNTYTVNEDVTLKAKASKDGLESEEATFAYTVKETVEPEPADGKVYKLSAELATGDKVIIYNAGSGKAVSSTIKSTYYLTPAALSVSSDTIVTDDATVEWEVTVNDDGTYTFTQGTLVLGGTQTTNSAGNIYNNIVLSNPAASKWTLSGETLYLGELTSKYASEGGQIYLEYYERYDEFSLFDTSRNTTDAFKFAFYKLDENAEPVEPVTKYTVTVEPSEGGTVTVSKTSVEEGEEVVITVTPNEGYELEKLLVNNVETEVTGGKATVKITADTTVKATFKKTSTDPQPADSEVEWVLVEDAAELTDGDQVIVYNASGKYAMSNKTLANYYRDLETVTIEDGKVVNPPTTAIWNLGVKTDASGAKTYTFTTQDGHVLSAGTRNSLPLDDVNQEWNITRAATDGAYYIINVGRSTQYVEYYSSKNEFSAYSYSAANEAIYAMHLYKAVEKEDRNGLITDLSTLEDGDLLVVYNESGKYAMSNKTLANYYRDLETVTIEDDKVVNPADTALWTLGIKTDESGAKTYTFTTQDGHVLSAGTRNSLPLDDANQEWNITEAATDGAYYIINVGRPTQYVEYYSSKNEFSAYSYSAANEAVYAMKLYRYVKKDGTDPVEPTGKEYGLTSKLEDGDKVILYNAKNGVGLGNALTGYKINGVSLTPEDGIITTDNTAVVWTVVKNSDGTYSFAQGNYTLGGVVSGTYNNLVVTGAAYTSWKLTGPDASDFNYFMYLKDMTSNYGNVYLEYYSGFTLYGSSAPDKAAFGITFYKEGAEPEVPNPEETGDLVTNLNQLKDGTTVAIYSPGHKTAISTKPNGDWYLKANAAIVENGKVVNFTSDFVWVIKKNADGTFTFVSNDDNTKSILVWPSGNYAELTVDAEKYSNGDNTWTLTPAKTANCFYASSPTISGTSGPAYIEAYVRNEFEVFSGYFTSPSSNKFTESEFALQFYLVNPEDAVEAVDDGEWDGVLEKGGQYVAYNDNAKASIGLFKEANYSMDAIPTEIEGNLAVPGNGAYVFKIDTMGRYYSFEVNGKFLATNPAEELFFVEKDEDGKLPETAKWWLKEKEGGYIIYNKEATYNGTPVCIEYYSSVFSGWTFSTKNEVGIYLFNFYKVTDDTKVYEDIVQKPKVIFDCEDSRHLEEDYKVSFSLDDLAPEISAVNIYIAVNRQQTLIEDYETDESRKVYNFVIPAETIDRNEKPREFDLHVEVTNSYDISYEGVKKVAILDEPFFEDMTPAPNAQTHEDKKPVISVKVGNVGENPVFKMTVNGKEVKAVYENGVLSYTPAEDMEDGRVSVAVNVTREDGVTAETSWNFIVGDSVYQLYFGQLHSHTTYSDGSGSLETALDYIANLPESANVQFVAFTDHSNYFDTTSASNPADAMNDKSLMTDASRAVWETYKGTVASFNEKHNDLIAIAGYEMTWSGGPGHINSFNTDGLVSRNNAELNNKAGDAGMKLYYDTMIKDLNTLHQFNHPGTTFGNFTDFNYWNEEYDKVMFLVEVGNGEGQIGAGGYYPSYEQYTLALDKGWHVAPTNNQDNHKGRWGNANDARDVVMVESFTEEGIYDAIRNLRVYATEDKNLEITYTVNGDPMGTVYAAENIPEKLDVQVTVYDPDSSDSVSKVELIVDGGKVAHTWDNAEELVSGELTAELSPEYTYYYVRVTQKDGDLAVTAPVWTGLSIKMGINEIKSKDDDKVYTGKEATLVTTLFNNEDTAATVKSLTYTVNGSEVIGTDTEAKTLPANGTLEAEFKHVFSKAKITEVEVTAIIELDGKEYEYKANVELDVIDEETENVVTPIADVRAASNPKDTGYRFVIEGVVTSNASGYDKDTAFFDCVYVQDETGGICVFPVSGNYKIGDKVRIVGHTDFYQGEPELQVKELEVIGEGSIDPTEITSAQLTSREVEGKLVTLKGVIESVEEANGLIQTIMVRDEAGNLARVFIDGYITTTKEVVDALVGANVEATGLASYDDTWADTENFPRIRVRNRADIVCTLPEYSFKEGEYTYTLGSEETVELPSDIPADQFKEVKVGENALTGDDYEVKEDGTLVLKPEYLETLEPGEYTVTVTTDFGEVTVSFTVEEAAPDEVEYKIIEGANQTYIKGTNKDLLIVSDAPFEKFVEVRIDGKVVDKANYTAVSGSTEVTLKASYVETLAEGKHTFTIVSNDGEASTNLTVKAAEQPGTGVSGMNPIWYSAFYAAIIGMFFALIRRKQED
ncbi:MAG: CehA/McbA family metallohydrolase [Erysipelotrichales bacterium]|nr:CehA/McbA family metallohydrolase [Erysipelotrichales bacterium]